jgi:hypothetical protein
VIALLAALALGQDVVNIHQVALPNPFGGNSRLTVWFEPEARLDPPKYSPKLFGIEPDKAPLEFDYSNVGLVHVPGEPDLRARFFVYEQQRKQKDDIAFPVTDMLLRLWEYNFFHLNLDHNEKYVLRCVDVYLCWGGSPGGEQLFDIDKSFKGNQYVNTIYIYDLPSFNKPIEMAREVAHEYGHATLPVVGGFKNPEDWGNGYLGEKLFLTYMRDELAKGQLKPEDAMGATAADLDTWVKANVDPLVVKAASSPPNLELLGGTGQASMNAYMGLVLYCSQIFPDEVFQQVLSLMKSPDAKDIPPMILLAIDRSQEISLKIPSSLEGKPIWVPISTAKVQGATVVSTKDGWALIKPTGTVKLINPAR